MANTVSAFGAIASFLGVLFAIYQIRRTRKSAEAAEEASKEVSTEFHRSTLIADISKCNKFLDETILMVREGQLKAANIRVADLKAQLSQLRPLTKKYPGMSGKKFQNIVGQLAIINENLEMKICNIEETFNPARTNQILSGISTDLNEWIGNIRY